MAYPTHILYSDEKLPFTGKVKIDQMDPHKKWIVHYGNYRFLKFMYDNSTDRSERFQAGKEMSIAQRKMDWWKRHPKWNPAIIQPMRAKVDSDWNSKR